MSDSTKAGAELLPESDLGNPDDWAFKGEGNANAVFSYIGSLSNLRGHVLRICKHPFKPARDSPDAALEKEVWAGVKGMDHQDPARQGAAFLEHVMRPLLGAHNICHQEIVQVSPSFSATLREHLRVHGRPSAREPTLEYGVLMPDHTTFPGCPKPFQSQMPLSHGPLLSHGPPQGPMCATLCVEIKPKWGCSMDEPLQEQAQEGEEGGRPRPLSRYQMKQHLKLAQGKIKALSTYDPRDLFSGDDVAMLRALEALLAAPQNNLKLFLNGSPVPEARVAETFDAVANEFSGSRTGFLHDIISALKTEGILQRLLAAQCLDKQGTAQIHAYLQQLRSTTPVQKDLDMDVDPPPQPGFDVDLTPVSQQGFDADTTPGSEAEFPNPVSQPGFDAQLNPGSQTGFDGDVAPCRESDLGSDLDLDLNPASQQEFGMGFGSALEQEMGRKGHSDLGSRPQCDAQVILGKHDNNQEVGAAGEEDVGDRSGPLKQHHCSDDGNLSRESMLRALRDYLISVSARDCSLMLTLQPCANPEGLSQHKTRVTGGPSLSAPTSSCQEAGQGLEGVSKGSGGGRGFVRDEATGRVWKYQLALVDLDLKRLRVVEKNLKLETDMVEHVGRQAKPGNG